MKTLMVVMIMIFGTRNAHALFAAGTQLQTGKDQEKTLESLRDYDPLMTTNHHATSGKVDLKQSDVYSKVMSTVMTSVLRIKYTAGGKDREIVVTEDQPFMLTTGKLETAKHLYQHEALLAADGTAAPIRSIHIENSKSQFGNLIAWELDEDNYFIANGVVVGGYPIEFKKPLPHPHPHR